MSQREQCQPSKKAKKRGRPRNPLRATCEIVPASSLAPNPLNPLREKSVEQWRSDLIEACARGLANKILRDIQE